MESELWAVLNKLIQAESVTPNSDGSLEYLADYLKNIGFNCIIKQFEDVKNLYAYIGDDLPNLCFAGHLDVVPANNTEEWFFHPFTLSQKEGILYGRGLVDMKGAIAAYLIAATRYGKPKAGSLSFLITCDEEGEAKNGTAKMLEYLTSQNITISDCIIGEPTSNNELLDTIKTGRRGSINYTLNIYGKQGHVAYPEKCINPNHILANILHSLTNLHIDDGNKDFQPSSLQITSITSENIATNIIPGHAKANFNIRFNNCLSHKEINASIIQEIERVTTNYKLDINVSAKPFASPKSKFQDIVLASIQEITGKLAKIENSGGTSDARFIKDYCNTIELGLKNDSAHQVNENCTFLDIETLSNVYYNIIKRYFLD